MKILKGTYGECRFCDNMDPAHGLPSLAAKSWDLCLTDPPYGINYTYPSGLGECPAEKWKATAVLYDDTKTGEAYHDWCRLWMDELLRITSNVIFTPGNPNIKFWILNYDVYDMLVWFKRNSQSGGKAAYLLRHEMILIMNKMAGRKVTESVFDICLQNGFHRKDYYLHPAPKEIRLWQAILTQVQPASVLEPFLGSGTTAEVCESLGIPWLGFEIMEEYAPDIEKRIAAGKRKHAQQTLTQLIK